MTEQPTTEIAPSQQPTTNSSDGVQPKREAFSTGFQFHEFSALLAVMIPIAFIALGLIESLGLLWRPIAGVLYLLLLVAGMFILLISGFELVEPGEEEVAVGLVVVSGLFVIVSFSQLSRYLYLWFGGFTASQSGYWHWLRFGIANVLESVLFDIPAIYNWNVTEIRGITFWSQTLVFLFRTSIEFLVVAQLIRAIGFAKTAWRNVPPSQHDHYLGFMFSKLGRLLVFAIWAIPLFIGIGAIANDGLSLDSTVIAFKLGSPIAFGVWLTWESLRALFSVKGGWNKVLALGGMALGVWLIKENWPMFIAFMKL